MLVKTARNRENKMIVYNKSWKNFSIYLKVVAVTLWGFLILSLKQYIIDGDMAPIVGLAGGRISICCCGSINKAMGS